ncbi:MAG: ion transporter, partial [Minisyncoccia bacterium]
LKWGWIDLVSSIPMIEILRWGRVFQLIRILRLLKAFKSSRHLLHNIFSNRAEGTVVTTFLLAFLLIILSSIAILHVETAEHSNIKTAEDAIWWSYTTKIGFVSCNFCG